MPCLIIETEGQSAGGRTVELGNESIIGREKSNNVYIDDPRASRQHAKITKEPDGSYLLVDMGSRNGIIVNNEKVSRRKLIEKDRVVIGRTTLIYSESASVPAPAPTQPAAPAETLKLASDDPPTGTSDKTITADPLGRPVGEPAKLTSDALQRAIQEVAATRPEDKTSTGTKKPAPVSSLSMPVPPGVPAGSGTPKSTQAPKTAVSGEVIDEEPTLGKRIIVFLAFLIFFVTILLFAKEITKRLLSKAEKSQQTKNIPSSNQPK